MYNYVEPAEVVDPKSPRDYARRTLDWDILVKTAENEHD